MSFQKSSTSVSVALGAWLLATGPISTAQTGAYPMSYGGRLTTPAGEAIRGPVNLDVKIFATASGGSPLWSQSFGNVPLDSGVFQVDLATAHTVLIGPNATFVEITDTSNNVVYPRQRITAVPFALRIPVDGSTLVYGTDGKLAVGTIDASKVTGLNAASVITSTSTLEPKAIRTRGDNAVAIQPDNGSAGSIRFYDPTAGSTTSVGFRAPSGISTNALWTLPQRDGSSGQFLQTNGSGALSWGTPTGLNDLAVNSIDDAKLMSITTPGKVYGNAVSGGTITATLDGNATNVTGIVAIAHGGTGLGIPPSANQLPTGNGTGGYILRSLQQGPGIAVSYSSDSIQISTAPNTATISSDYTVTPSDQGKTLLVKGDLTTLTLPSAASAGNGFYITVKAIGWWTVITPSGADPIEGVSNSMTLENMAVVQLVTNSSAWYQIHSRGRVWNSAPLACGDENNLCYDINATNISLAYTPSGKLLQRTNGV